VVTAERVAMQLKKLDFLITGIAHSGEQAIASVKSKAPDLILMDIKLDGVLNGIETIKIINETTPNIQVIFVTSYDDTATMRKAKAVHPCNFLAKPFTIRHLKTAIDFAVTDLSPNTSKEFLSYQIKDSIFLKKNDTYHKVAIQNILWIQAKGAYLNIKTTTENYLLSMNLTQFIKQFSYPSLIRVNRSFIVNFDKIESIKGNQVIIQNEPILISAGFVKNLNVHFSIIKR
jgi:DNA-binding LytR/AlgR family response regulator